MSYRFRRNGRLWVPEAGRYGIGGGSLSFDGVDDVVSRATVTIGQAFTFGVWIKPATLGEGNIARILEHGPDLTPREYFYISSGPRLQFAAGRTVTDGSWRPTASVLTLGAWQHVAVSYSHSSNSNDPTLYLNGVSQAITESGAPSGTATADGVTLYVGNTSGGDRTWDGLIGGLVCITRELTADEHMALYLMGPLAVAGRDQMILWWDMEGSDANARDLSGNGRDGTLTGPTLAEHYPASSFAADAVQVVMR